MRQGASFFEGQYLHVSVRGVAQILGVAQGFGTFRKCFFSVGRGGGNGFWVTLQKSPGMEPSDTCASAHLSQSGGPSEAVSVFCNNTIS